MCICVCVYFPRSKGKEVKAVIWVKTEGLWVDDSIQAAGLPSHVVAIEMQKPPPPGCLTGIYETYLNIHSTRFSLTSMLQSQPIAQVSSFSYNLL